MAGPRGLAADPSYSGSPRRLPWGQCRDAFSRSEHDHDKQRGRGSEASEPLRAGSTELAMSAHAALQEVLRLNERIAKLFSEGRYREAIPDAERSLALREQMLGPMHIDVADGLNTLGLLHLNEASYAKAEPLLVRALDMFEKVLGPNDPRLAPTLINLGELHGAQGAYDKAEPFYRRAIDT